MQTTDHPGLRPDSRLTPELIAEYTATGLWVDEPLRVLLSDAAQRHPDRVAAVGHREGASEPQRLTYAELDRRVHQLACGLAALGVGPGDAVAVMLPNWVEFAALIFAINEVGAVYTGIPPAYGERELRVILRRSGARVLVVPGDFRGGGQLDLARRLRPELDALEHVVVVGGPAAPAGGELPFDTLLDAPDRGFPPVDPAALCHVGFTSGTTGEPKGVMNTSQTLSAVMRNWTAHVGAEHLGDPMVNLIASPVGHHTGFLWGVLLTTYQAGTGVYLDRWEPERAAGVIAAEGVTALFGAPTFLQDLLRTSLADRPDGPLRIAVLAGAPVPRSLPEVAGAAFGCDVCPAWGMTEFGIGISCAPHLPAAVQLTDGVPVAGCEARVLTADGRAGGAGESGELQIRGAGLFLGYLGRPDATAEAIDADGWFTTGDVAQRGADGSIVLQGRTKDIVIRGGENIPVVDVESLLFEHPDVVAAAVVGVPDERLGERACAVVVPAPGARPTLDALCTYLSDRGLSKHFLPERLELVTQLPMTASGKVRKVELRARLTAAGEEG
ncbi:MAG TPA: AMP-binding protein [Pseudonocardia sp.]|nr:AMP-binding protein [Pseudonocardia sp.]